MPKLSRALISFLFVLGCLAFATPSRADRDIVQFGDTIRVGADATAHDTVCFFCSIDIAGSVDGDVVAFFGSVRIDGHANHDVVVFFGDVKAGNDTSIGQNLVNFFGSVRLGENVSVGRDLVVMFGSLHAAESVRFGGDRVVQPGWIFWVPFLLIFGGISLVIREFRGYHRRRLLRGY